MLGGLGAHNCQGERGGGEGPPTPPTSPPAHRPAGLPRRAAPLARTPTRDAQDLGPDPPPCMPADIDKFTWVCLHIPLNLSSHPVKRVPTCACAAAGTSRAVALVPWAWRRLWPECAQRVSPLPLGLRRQRAPTTHAPASSLLSLCCAADCRLLLYRIPATATTCILRTQHVRKETDEHCARRVIRAQLCRAWPNWLMGRGWPVALGSLEE